MFLIVRDKLFFELVLDFGITKTFQILVRPDVFSLKQCEIKAIVEQQSISMYLNLLTKQILFIWPTEFSLHKCSAHKRTYKFIHDTMAFVRIHVRKHSYTYQHLLQMKKSVLFFM